VLVLTRKIGQTITVGHEITITIMEVKGGQVKIGVEAPKNVMIHRGEIYERIQEENMAAANARLSDLESITQALKRRLTKDVPDHSS